MTTFRIIRHAEKCSVTATGDPTLSPHGVVQAQATGRYLAGLSIDAIYSSPLARARGTAELIAQDLRLPIRISPALRERANWGDDSSQSHEAFAAMWEYASQHRDWQPPTGDCSRQAGSRLDEFLQSLSDTYPDDHVVVVTHGGIIGDLVRNIFPDSEIRRYTENLFAVAHCSITTISRVAGRYRIAEYANASHLHTPGT